MQELKSGTNFTTKLQKYFSGIWQDCAIKSIETLLINKNITQQRIQLSIDCNINNFTALNQNR